MKRGRRVFIILLVFGAVAVVVPALWPGEREPVYQGKKLSEWIYRAGWEPSKSEEAMNRADAVRHIGTNGLPFLVDWIRDGAKVSKIDPVLTKVSQKAPGPWLKFRSKHGQLAWDSAWAFGVLGKEARPAIPDLVQLRESNNAYVSTIATMALYGIGTNPPPALLEIPADFVARGRATNSARGVAPEILEKGEAGRKRD